VLLGTSGNQTGPWTGALPSEQEYLGHPGLLG